MKGTFTGINNAYLETLLECGPRAVKIAVAMAGRHNGHNNGSIPFSVREGVAVTRSSHRLVREALNELQERGLIECIKQAGFDFHVGARRRESREWKLNFVWEKKR